MEGKFMFTKNDLALYTIILEEFRTRHKTLASKIEQSYKIGNLMMEYLEKQIILDYHLKGEQHILEKLHPNLAEKAKKYLGFEFYYQISAKGKKLSQDDLKYLLQKFETLNKKYQEKMEAYQKA